MRRRFLSVLLALSMVLTLVPATAWADEMPTEPAGQETPVEIPDETPEGTQGPETAPEEEADAEPAETPAEDTANETENADENNADVEIPDAEAEAPKAEEEADAEDGIMLLEEGDEAADASGMPAAVDGKITLTADVTLKSVYTVTETVELDLSGHKISAEDGSNFSGNSLICVNGGNLTITDSGKTRDASLDEKTGTVTDYTGGSIVFDGAGRPKSVINVQGGGTLTLKGGKISHVTVDSKAGNSGIAVFAGSTANIEGGYIVSQEASVIPQGEGATLNIKGGVIRSLDNGAYMGNGLAANGGTVTNMTGGTLIGEIQSQGYIACCFYHPQSGELNISGGTIYSKDGVAVCIRNGSMNITEGATLISNGDSSKSGKIGDLKDVVHGTVLQVDYAPGYNHNDDPREISITGGTFTGAADKIINVNNAEGYKAVKNFVQGGIFNKAIDETYVTEGFECKGNDDGTFGIAAKKLVVNTEEGEAPVISGVYVPNTDNSNKEEGVEAAGSTVTFDASNEGATDEQKKAATVNIEPSTIGSLAETMEVTNVEIRTNAGTVTLDAAALEALHANAAEATGEEEKQIVLEVKQVEDKPANTVAAYEIKLTMAEDETSLLPVGSENGNVTITVEYTGDADKDGNVSVYYAKDKNTIVEKIATVKPVNGKVTFTTGHLSMYSIATDATLADANVAKIGDTAYPSLKAAVDAAETGATITLLRDTTMDGCIDVNGKAITIDGQGHSVKAMDTYADGQGFKPSTKTETTNSGTNTSGHYSMLRVASGKDAAKAELTLKNVTLDAKQQVRVIYCGPNSKLTIEDGTMITGGMGVSEKNGAATSYIGGVYMNSTSELIMNGGTITGNTSAGEYANDGYLEYSGDLWVGNNAKAELNGGAIGKTFINATELGGNVGGALTMNGGTINAAFVEAEANHSGKVVKFADGTIEKLLIAMDYEEEKKEDDKVKHPDRVVVSIDKPEAGEDRSFTGLEIPAGETATVIKGAKDGELSNPIKINEGATLIIPAGTTVKVVNGLNGEIPAITNNGTLQVDGKLIAGTDTTDTTYLKITNGTGATITGKGTIDLDPDDENVTTLTFTFHLNDGTNSTIGQKA